MRPLGRLVLLVAVIGTAGVLRANPQPQAESGTGAISGTVVDAQTGAPLRGAVVSLNIGGRAARSRQLTDPKGRFVFLGLPASDRFYVNATGSGYVDGGYGRTPDRPAGAGIRLADGEWFRDAQITLWRPAAISGRVLDERGEPVVGVPVRVLAQILVGGRPQLAAGPGTLTDDRGAYRIAGLRPGRYLVQVPSVQSTVPAGVEPAAAPRPGQPRTPRMAVDTPGGFRYVVGDYATPALAGARPLVYPIGYHLAARSPSEATAIDLHYGDDRQNLDITIVPVPTATITGTVYGPPDALAGLLLRLLPEGVDDIGLGGEVGTSLVDARGAFAFLNVPAGSYSIEARGSLSHYTVLGIGTGSIIPPSPPGFVLANTSGIPVASAPTGTSLSTRRGSGNTAYWGRAAVAVGGQDVDGVTLEMQRGATLSGRYVWDGPLTPPGSPTGVQVIAEPADGNAALGTHASGPARSAREPFAIQGLLPGRYTLRVVGQGALLVASIALNGQDHTYRPIDLTSGRDVDDVVITFTDKATRLSGVLRGGSGETAAGGVAIAFPVEREQWSGYGLSSPRIRSAVADTGGEYRITTLPAGEYFVVAVSEDEMDGWQDPAFLDLAHAQAVRVSIGWGETKVQDVRVVRVR
jgi:hypothetical protein